MGDLHCPVIHGALQINLTNPSKILANSCCLRSDLKVVDPTNIWSSPTLNPLRQFNLTNQWHQGCNTCRNNEAAGQVSFRSGMLEKFGAKTNLSGPQRLDLMFDNSCNLACRSCLPGISTFWQKHLKDNNIHSPFRPVSRADDMIKILKTLNLSNLEMVVFCGGETLLGQSHWQVAEAIAEMAPNAKERIILCFQTNGTQTITKRNINTIKKFHLVKLNISLDAVGKKFNYLRWPASWEQVTENILTLRKTLPVNVMFLIEETISVLNLHYQHELEHWVKENFSTNKTGDITNHTRHAAVGFMNIKAITNEYFKSLQGTTSSKLLPSDWKEDSSAITHLIEQLDKFDKIRNENWRSTFPEIAKFYKRFDSSGR